MNICFVYEYYYPHIGGGEVLFQRLAEGIAARGHKVCVITSLLADTQKNEVLNGVEIRRVPVPRFAERYWFTFLAYREISAAAARADVIQVGTYNGAPAAWLAARRHRKPVVLFPFEVLGDLWFKVGLNPVSALAFRIFEQAVLTLPYDAYSCISQSTMKSLVRFRRARGKAFLAYPGIDYDLFDPSGTDARNRIRERLGVDERTFLCSYTGRPGVVKGVEFLLRAVPEIRKRIPEARLLLLLSKSPRAKYKEAEKLAAELGDDAVIFRDQVMLDELPGYHQASDCIIIPSLNEGFGFTCVEACTMERPVVVTTAGSLPEVVSGRYVTIAPGDSHAIADGVDKVYGKEYTVTGLKRFTWDEAVDTHLKVFERLTTQADKTRI